ncbi:MAG: SEL1-like repeat protein [Marivivens sp.]|nr:SEL1-like repeat protein [Marivivens sp.]
MFSFTCRGIVSAALISSALIVGSFPSAFAQTNSVQELLQQGDFEAVSQIWEDAIANGDLSNMRNLAKLHYSGALRLSDTARALELLKSALDAGDIAASLDLGYIYQGGIGVQKDLAAAEYYFELAYQAGNNEAAYLYSKLILSRSASDQEIGAALEALRRSSMVGYGPSLSAVADLMRTGTYMPTNLQTAVDYYEKAGQNGYFQGFNSIGDMYAFAEMGPADLNKAVEWYELAASNGIAAANYSLAMILYSNPESSEEDLTRAFEYAKVAALSWDEGAQTLLGRMYLEGRAVPIDAFEAYFWLDLAASASVLEAHHLRAIASQMIGNDKSEQAHTSASEWFTQNHATPHIHRLLEDNFHAFK